MHISAPLPIYLTVDVGPADAVMGHGHSRNPVWSLTFEGLMLLSDTISLLENRLRVTIPVTWFVRADRLVKNQFGERLSIMQMFMDAMGASVFVDHELGWMPQLPVEGGGEIEQDDLRHTHAELIEFLPRLDSVRMGDCYHDNISMRFLDELGVKFDSSALPGRKKDDNGWHMDWSGTPIWAYHPSCEDYRHPGGQQLGILEIPLSVLQIKAPYDLVPLMRYVNPCFFRNLLWPELTNLLAVAPYIVCILHPDELVSRKQCGHPLVAYSVNNFMENLAEVVNQAHLFGRTVSFHRMRDFEQSGMTAEVT